MKAAALVLPMTPEVRLWVVAERERVSPAGHLSGLVVPHPWGVVPPVSVPLLVLPCLGCWLHSPVLKRRCQGPSWVTQEGAGPAPFLGG